MHIALLGDSILDNQSYVAADEPDVRAQLAALMNQQDRVTLKAVDGSVLHDVGKQLTTLPDGVTHLVISAGGNDLLLQLGMLDKAVSSVYEVLGLLATLSTAFVHDYQEMLEQVLSHRLPVVVCTVYNPRFPEPEMPIFTTALRVFNDCIIQQAAGADVPIIELRSICTAPEDFANPIEPSAIGGEKIARAIKRVVNDHAFSNPSSRIYTE